LLTLTPIITYSNADTQKLQIIKENKGKSGIYCWTNINTGFSYVGSSIDLSKRLLNYFNINYLTKPGRNMIISRSLLKNGYSSFKVEILEYCSPEDTLSREQYYLDLLKPKYNILTKAGSMAGFKHSEESKIKISKARFGLKFSEETKKKNE
jgi:group I intron endonuclease